MAETILLVSGNVTSQQHVLMFEYAFYEYSLHIRKCSKHQIKKVELIN